MSELTCEVCGEVNGWVLLDPAYECVCRPCVEAKEAEIPEGGEVYRRIVRCRGCDQYGAVNYGDDQFYCNGSHFCTP